MRYIVFKFFFKIATLPTKKSVSHLRQKAEMVKKTSKSSNLLKKVVGIDFYDFFWRKSCSDRKKNSLEKSRVKSEKNKTKLKGKNKKKIRPYIKHNFVKTKSTHLEIIHKNL